MTDIVKAGAIVYDNGLLFLLSQTRRISCEGGHGCDLVDLLAQHPGLCVLGLIWCTSFAVPFRLPWCGMDAKSIRMALFTAIHSYATIPQRLVKDFSIHSLERDKHRQFKIT